MAPRSRTGCLTCRQRKLKCDEQRPVCSQCIKANRPCMPSSGITFRHQQNPSMNGSERGADNLKNFYGYKETFQKSTTWVKVPPDLTFIYTNNPYNDEDDGSDEGLQSFLAPPTEIDLGAGSSAGAPRDDIDERLASGLASLADSVNASLAESRYQNNRREHGHEQTQATYPQYSTHGLEALSAVASQGHYSYETAPASPTRDPAVPSYQSPLTTPPQQSNATPANSSLNFILNPKERLNSTPGTDSNIDPQLHSEVTPADAGEQLPAQKSPTQGPSVENQP